MIQGGLEKESEGGSGERRSIGRSGVREVSDAKEKVMLEGGDGMGGVLEGIGAVAGGMGTDSRKGRGSDGVVWVTEGGGWRWRDARVVRVGHGEGWKNDGRRKVGRREGEGKAREKVVRKKEQWEKNEKGSETGV